MGAAVWGEHGGGGTGMSAGGILSAADVRYGDGGLGGGGASICLWRWSFWLAGVAPAQDRIDARDRRTDRSLSRWPVLFLRSALSGACALGAEVVWTRLMGMLLLGHGVRVLDHPRGISGGSGGGRRGGLVGDSADAAPALALGVCQILLTVGDRVDSGCDHRHPAVLERRYSDHARPVA